MSGKLHKKGAMILRLHVGTASDDSGNQFEMFNAAATGCPGIYCKNTGRYFTLGWPEILEMAEAAGITVAQEEKEGA